MGAQPPMTPEVQAARKSIRVLVCGGRDYADYQMLSNTLRHISEIMPISAIIHGGAKGADSLAHNWAQWRNVPVERYDAEWDLHGNAAGPIRNQRMLDEARPNLVVAFPGGTGTNHMVTIAKAAGVRVMDLRTARVPNPKG